MIVIPLSFVVAVQSAQTAQNPPQALEAFEAAFATRALDSFKAENPGPVRVVIRHALKEGPAGVERRGFKSFKDLESFLRSREVGDPGRGEDLLPRRIVPPRRSAGTGLIAYELQGIAHNTLYLSRVLFLPSPQGLRIREIEFYDGD